MPEVRLAPMIGPTSRVDEVVGGYQVPADTDSVKNPKGARTWNHVMKRDLLAGKARRMLAWRNKGEVVGNHFHPRVPNKDPEIFEFLLGDADIWFEDLYGEKRTLEIRIPLGGAPYMCLIPPYILHGVIVWSDMALFEEFQEGPMDPNATYSDEEFYHLRASRDPGGYGD